MSTGSFTFDDTMGYSIPEHPMLHANLRALSFTEPELWGIEVYIE